MTRLIIFDWDDVITLGAKEGYYNCYRETLKKLDILLPEDEFHQRIQRRWGQPFREELRELLLERPELLDRACEIYDAKFWGNTFVDCLREVPGANDTLRSLAERYKLAVATGNHPKMLKERISSRFNVPDIFSQIITSHDVPVDKSKPSPYMLEVIMRDQNVQPGECVYVGDAENDVHMARNAGIEPVVVLTGHLNTKNAESLGVEHILPDITHLNTIL